MKTVLGSLINRRRKELGLTQKALGERLSISGQAVSGWEIEGKYPDITTLPALKRVLSLTEEELLNAIEGIEKEVESWTDSENVNLAETEKETNKTVRVEYIKMAERALKECLYKPKDKYICITNKNDLIAYDLRRTELYLIAGVDLSIRKMLLLNITRNVLENHQGKVYFFTMGTLGKDLIKRLIAIKANVSTRFYMVGDHTDDERENIAQAGEFFRNADLYIDEQRYPSIEEIYQKCTSIHEDLDLIVINGMKSISVETIHDNAIASRLFRDRTLHGIAIDCRCPIVLTDEMNEDESYRGGNLPKIEDIDDQEIARSANHLWLIDYQDRYRKCHDKDHTVNVIVVKERYRGVFKMVNSRLTASESKDESRQKPYTIKYDYDEVTGCLTAKSIIPGPDGAYAESIEKYHPSTDYLKTMPDNNSSFTVL